MRKFGILFALLAALLLPQGAVFAQYAPPEDSAVGDIGYIEPPPGTKEYIEAAGAEGGDIAIIFFISRMITLITIIASLWVVFSIILASYLYITSSGDAAAHTKVKDLLTMSVLGLALIIFAYTAAGLVGLLIFGDATFILNPKLEPL